MPGERRCRDNFVEYLRRVVPAGQWALACELYTLAIEEAKAEARQEQARSSRDGA